ncbi:MAG: GtrA family protein [Microcystis sp. M038S2]|jgi:putative flippase GtrA|uniref:GtrA family protein n=1 Tax=unclassified Microcystis TaxID=2643300 RepID=UPI0025863709|nr:MULTISPECIES: GtrA family protein [unclassified Microcystis]MCA2686238.1 GtrA family protein [Microcystis sp. M046S2]MCA2706115.1 GtrA family protein [Microcystis sp. M038S2]MCA2948902.1 GtrA family protein [Microcystis sp. M109S1]MCA2949967.1 GtrA family protein [Microcystis sp. M112S1]
MYLLKKHKFVAIVKKHKFARFFLVGVLNTLFGYFLYGTLILIGLDYKYAVLLATILGVLFNFQTTGRLVFGSKNNKLIFRFVLVYVATFLLNVEALRVVDAMNINIEQKTKMLIAGAILLLPMAVLSFVLMKLFVFREGSQ